MAGQELFNQSESLRRLTRSAYDEQRESVLGGRLARYSLVVGHQLDELVHTETRQVTLQGRQFSNDESAAAVSNARQVHATIHHVRAKCLGRQLQSRCRGHNRLSRHGRRSTSLRIFHQRHTVVVVRHLHKIVSWKHKTHTQTHALRIPSSRVADTQTDRETIAIAFSRGSPITGAIRIRLLVSKLHFILASYSLSEATIGQSVSVTFPVETQEGGEIYSTCKENQLSVCDKKAGSWELGNTTVRDSRSAPQRSSTSVNDNTCPGPTQLQVKSSRLMR